MTSTGRHRVKCLLDSGASHCFLSSALAAQLPPGGRRQPAPGHPKSVRQADGSSRPAGGAVAAQLILGGLDEETAFVEFDVYCDADLILGYDWLRAHDLAFLYDRDQACLCAESGCSSGRRVRLDLVLDQPAVPASRLAAADIRARLGKVGLDSVPTLDRPSQWTSPTTHPSRAAALTTAADAAWAADTLAGIADACTTLADGTELLVGSIAFSAEGPAFSLPPDAGDPPEFAALPAEFCDVLGGPPPGLPPDRGQEFELRIETSSHPMPRSRPMKRWSQGELDECRKQVAYLLDQGWIVPSRASHAASVVFARKPDGTWRFCQDFRGLNAITQRSVEPLPHVEQHVDETRGARFFSKLDLESVDMQFCIREEDQFKTSFRVPGGQYEFRVGAFGLHGMSSVLMRYMHSIFGRPDTGPPMLGRSVQVYCDDILIFSKTRAEHLEHVRLVLETLRRHKVYAKASKCQFGRSSVGFLGHVISEHGVAVDPRKVAAVAEWAQPTSCTEGSPLRRPCQLLPQSSCCASPPWPPR